MAIDIDDYSPKPEINEQLTDTWYIALIAGGAVGKNTVMTAATEIDERFSRVISCTDREPRPGEKDGIDYHFKSAEKRQRVELEKRILGGEVVQAATSPNGRTYYWSEVEEWKKTPYAMMDIWQHEYTRRGFKELSFRGRTAIMLVCKPELWIPRLDERYPPGSRDRRTRLIDANRALNWGFHQRENVFWVENKDEDGGEFAGSMVVDIALSESKEEAKYYVWNTSARKVADEMYEALQEQLGNRGSN